MEELPVEAVASRLLPLNIRNPHRLHVAAESHPHSSANLVYRLVRGMSRDGETLSIVDAWIENGEIVLLSPVFDRLAVYQTLPAV